MDLPLADILDDLVWNDDPTDVDPEPPVAPVEGAPPSTTPGRRIDSDLGMLSKVESTDRL